MHPIIRKLHHEHVHLSRLLDLLDRQLAAIHAGDKPDYDLMLDIMNYVTHFPDLFHHPKEDLVFERLRARDPASTAVVGRLLREHRQIIGKGKEFFAVLENAVNDVILPRGSIEQTGRDYVGSLRRHMDTEEGDVLRRAEKALLPEDWERIEQAAQEGPDPLFGGVVAQDYRALAQYIGAESG